MTKANNPNQNPQDSAYEGPRAGKDFEDQKPCESKTYASSETVQCRDCNEASIAFGTNEEVTYCRVYRQFRSIDFQRQCGNFLEA
jgi:hypothetical protein